EVRLPQLFPDRLDLARDLPERDAQLGRLAAQPFDLGQKALEASPVRLELRHPTVGVDDETDRVLALSGVQGRLGVAKGVPDRDLRPGALERLPPFSELREPSVDKLVALGLEAGLGRPEDRERLRTPAVGLAERGLAELVRKVRGPSPELPDEVHPRA